MSDLRAELELIVGEFIALKFDVDTDEFADGTKARWDNMLAKLTKLIQANQGCVDCKKVRCENCERLWQT